MADRYDKIVETISLVLGLMNLQENLTQSDKQDIVDNFNNRANELLSSIENHLKIQDEKLDKIYNLLYNYINQNNKKEMVDYDS